MTIRAEVAARIEANDPRVLLDELCERWELSATGTSLEAFTRLAFDQLGGGPGYGDSDIDLHKDSEYGLRQLDETIEKHEQEAITVFNKIKQLDPAGDEPDLQRRASKVLEMIYYAKRIVLSAFQARLGVHELNSSDFRLAEDLDILLGSWTLRFRWIDQTKSTPLQKVLLHLLDMAMEKRYRKFDGMVYEPIVVNGHETHAWRTVCDIKQFVFASTRKELYFEQWSNLTSAGSKSVVEHLTHCEDYQFQFLKKDRTVFSFRNGLYLASEDRFHAYGSGGLSDTVVAAKFFDFEFEEHQGADWWDIPTPHMDVIMNFQEWSKEVQRWMYVVLGRLLYPVGDRDGWQIVPFMHGRASAGKSTIALKVAKLFYEPGDIGIVSNNMEKQFGISAFSDKLLVIGPEIGQGWRMEQLEFQSMASGESVSVAAKFKTAQSVEWTVPILLAGNEVPPFADNGGSIQRRFLVFGFEKAVTNGDMKLGDKLARELPALLLKCNRAYLEAAARWGTKNVWTVLPTYFHNTRAEMAQAVNSIEAFLACNDVVLEATAFTKYREFVDAWRAFTAINRYPGAKTVTKRLFDTPFEKLGLTIVKDTREYNGRQENDEWVLGVKLKEQSSGNGFLAG